MALPHLRWLRTPLHCVGVRPVMSVSARRTDTNPVRSPRSTPCITRTAAIVFSLRESANSARVAPLRGAAGAIVPHRFRFTSCSVLMCSAMRPLASRGAPLASRLPRRFAEKRAYLRCSTGGAVAPPPHPHISPSFRRHPQRLPHACLPRIMVGC